MEFEGIKTYNIAKFEDHRGEFYESYNEKIMEHFPERFVQTNISKSREGVFRGLHYQWDNPMGKLITVLDGEIIDVWMDIRQGSPTYGKTGNLQLKGKDPTLLYLPPGFAHGFYSLTDSIVKYECTAYYNKDGESGISFREVEFISKLEPVLSNKDRQAETFSEYRKNAKFFF